MCHIESGREKAVTLPGFCVEEGQKTAASLKRVTITCYNLPDRRAYLSSILSDVADMTFY